jgi:hypothetical protein
LGQKPGQIPWLDECEMGGYCLDNLGLLITSRFNLFMVSLGDAIQIEIKRAFRSEVTTNLDYIEKATADLGWLEI